MSAKVTDTAKAEVERVRQQAEAGVKSGAYWYPIKVQAAESPARTTSDMINRASSTSSPTATSGAPSSPASPQP